MRVESPRSDGNGVRSPIVVSHQVQYGKDGKTVSTQVQHNVPQAPGARLEGT